MPSSTPGSAMSNVGSAVLAGDPVVTQGSSVSLARQIPASSLMQDTLSRLWRNPGAIVGAIVLATVILLAIFAPMIAPYDPIAQDSTAIRAAPDAKHLFGADNFGRDVFSRVLYGGGGGLPVGFGCVGMPGGGGGGSGGVSGGYGGRLLTGLLRAGGLVLALPRV